MSVHVPAKDMHLVGVLSAIFNSQSHLCTKMTNIYHSVVSGDIRRNAVTYTSFFVFSAAVVMIKGKILVKYIPYADNYSLLNLN